MTQDPTSQTKGKVFDATVSLPVGLNSVDIVATDLSTKLGGPNVTTKRYSLTVAGSGNQAFAYDDNGNCTSAGGTTYEWDGEDRLTTVINGLLRSEFSYDGFGRRVSIIEKNNDSVTSTKKFIWCGTELAQELDVNNAVTRSFFAEGERIGAVNYYYSRDHLGSIRELTDGSGVIHARYDYDPYGRRGANQITSNPVEADFGFTGHYFHSPSGLHLALFRAYDADMGRWLNRDPIEEEGGFNLYGYVGNNPISNVDPDGLFFRELGESIGTGLYNLMMGDRGGADYNQNTMLYQRSAELGGGDNILPGVMADAVGTAVDLGTDAAASYAGAKLLGAAGSVVCRARKAVNLPAWRRVAIDMAHVAERHIPGGRLTAGRDLFPSTMSKDAVERAIRDAYRFGSKVSTQGERVFVQGQSAGMTIEMWVNTVTKIIETAYPVH